MHLCIVVNQNINTKIKKRSSFFSLEVFIKILFIAASVFFMIYNGRY